MLLLAISLILLPLSLSQELPPVDRLPPLPTEQPLSDGINKNELPTVPALPPPFPLLPPPPPPPPLPPPNFNSPMSKRVMSSMTDLPAVIKSQMEGNPTPLRNMISRMLGEGLLSKLITSPVQAAEEMGMPLEDLGFNKTEALKSLKSNLEQSNITSFIDPESIFGVDKRIKTATHAPVPTTTTRPQMYIEGKPIQDFDSFITHYNPKDKQGKPLFKASVKKSARTTTPNPEQVAIEEAMLRSQMQSAGLAVNQQFYDPSMGTIPIGNDPIPQPVSADIANTLDTNLIDPARIREVDNLLRRSPMRNPSTMYNRAPVSIGSPDTLTPNDMSMMRSPSAMAAALDPLNAPAVAFDSNIQNVVNTLKTKSVNSLSVNEIKGLQAVLQNFEQTIKTKELLQKKRELQALGDQLEMQKQEIEAQQHRERELKMKEQHLIEARQKIETQLQQELNNFQSGFGLNNQQAMTSVPIHYPSLINTPINPLDTAPFDPSLLEKALSQQTMGPEPMPYTPPTTTTTTRKPTTTRRPTTRRATPRRTPRTTTTTTTTTTTETPLPEVTEAGPMRNPLGGLSMGMSIVRKRPLPQNLLEEPLDDASDEKEYEEPGIIVPRVKENPFNLVKYNPEEKETEKVEEEDEDSADEAPRASGSVVRPPVSKRKPIPVTPIRKTTTTTTAPTTTTQVEIAESAEMTACECIGVSMERMVGSWVPALASPAVVSRINEAIGIITDDDAISPTCAKLELSVPKQSGSVLNTKMAISFMTNKKNKLIKLRGNALSKDNRSLNISIRDLHGNNITAPFCVLKAEGEGIYEYMVVVSTNGPCSEAALLVRDPETFFDNDNAELIKYFKHMINRKELEPLEAVSFSNDCTAH